MLKHENNATNRVFRFYYVSSIIAKTVFIEEKLHVNKQFYYINNAKCQNIKFTQ